jgi:hypothetical protein
MAESGLMLVGLFNCFAAWWMFGQIRTNEFMTQFALAVSFSGQMLFVIGLCLSIELHEPSAGVFCGIALFEVILALFVPNFIHRVLSSCAAMIALSFAIDFAGLNQLVPGITAAAFVVVWLNEVRWARHAPILQPAGYGFTFALLLLVGVRFYYYNVWDMFWYVGYRGDEQVGLSSPWMCAASISAVLCYMVYQLLERDNVPATGRAGVVVIMGSLFLAILSLWAPSIVIAFMILIVGFAVGNRVLLGLGIAGLCLFLSHYYYQMQLSLLVKAFVLAASGAILLIARTMLNRSFPLICRDSHDA